MRQFNRTNRGNLSMEGTATEWMLLIAIAIAPFFLLAISWLSVIISAYKAFWKKEKLNFYDGFGCGVAICLLVVFFYLKMFGRI